MSDTQTRLEELYYRKFGGKVKKKKLYKKALRQITETSRDDLRQNLGLGYDRLSLRDLNVAQEGLNLAIEIAATALSGKRTEEK